MKAEKLESLDDLKERGLCIIEDEAVVINHIPKVLKQKHMSPSDLSGHTGISRQNINAVLKGKMSPGIDFALKVSYVLDTPVDKLFELTDNAWIEPFKEKRDISIYFDVMNLEIIDNETRHKRIAETGYEYYDTVHKKFLTREEQSRIIHQFVGGRLEAQTSAILDKNEGMRKNQAEYSATDILKTEINERIIKVYRKLGRRLEPFIVKSE